jgi:hypothetical protein
LLPREEGRAAKAKLDDKGDALAPLFFLQVIPRQGKYLAYKFLSNLFF